MDTEFSLDYKPLSVPVDATRKISYHGSGEVHYSNTDNQRIFCEPIINITGKNYIGSYILPSITYLDNSLEVNNEESYKLVLHNDGPLQINFFLAPFNTNYANAIHYQRLFSFIIELSAPYPFIPIPEKAQDVFLTPKRGLFESQKIARDSVYIAFHQKINNINTPKAILYAPNGQGVWKIICSRSMRVSPLLDIGFCRKFFPNPKTELFWTSLCREIKELFKNSLIGGLVMLPFA